MTVDLGSIAGVMTTAAREELLLAPYAMHSVESRGRKYPEVEQCYRGPYQRDRDRILHSSAYRRLSGKMQVFTGEMGDYHRTRLTHTQEVASIARTMGRALRLNEDLIEALSLLHDIGHPPFGHAGEEALDELLAEDGGFSHNLHALTIVEQLEWRYTQFPGLNLTWEVLEGQQTRVDKSGTGRGPLLEVQVVDIADNITYDAHDTDDAVKLGLVTLEELEAIPLIHDCLGRVREQFVGISGNRLRKAIVHELIDRQVSDVLRQAGSYLDQAGLDSPEAARRSGFRIAPSAELAEQKQELESFLYERVYRHPQLIIVRREAQQRLQRLFEHLEQHPEALPARYQTRCEQVGTRRAIADYLAGMTDRYCDHQYQRLFGRGSGG